jgi:hypothetical protein
MGVRSYWQKSAPIQSPYCTNRVTALLRCCPCQGLPPLWSSSVQAMLSEVLRAGHEPTAGLSHLSTPDSILMSYQQFALSVSIKSYNIGTLVARVSAQ